jgi:glycosyltransferase involved in cell wall biosynthesis
MSNNSLSTCLILINSLEGLFSFRKELVETLLNSNILVTIASPTEAKATEYFKSLGCTIEVLEIKRRSTNPLQDLSLFFRFYNIIRSYKPDVVLSYTIKPNIYGGLACRMLKIPYIANITGLGTAVENPGFLQHLTTFLYRHALKEAQKVFFQNIENRAFFEKKRIAIGKYVLLPGSGVNLMMFTPLPYPSEETIEFVFISRIMKEKGIDEYLEAARFIRSKYPNTRFHVCGSFEESYKGIIYQYHEDGTIIYHGSVDDVREVLKITHCTVHPSYHEGMSNVLLESSACARPVITTNKNGCKEIVDEGINGFLVPVRDTESLIEAVERFIHLPHEQKVQMGLAGRKKVEREFDRQIVVDAYLSEINHILGEKEGKDIIDA